MELNIIELHQRLLEKLTAITYQSVSSNDPIQPSIVSPQMLMNARSNVVTHLHNAAFMFAVLSLNGTNPDEMQRRAQTIEACLLHLQIAGGIERAECDKLIAELTPLKQFI